MSAFADVLKNSYGGKNGGTGSNAIVGNNDCPPGPNRVLPALKTI